MPRPSSQHPFSVSPSCPIFSLNLFDGAELRCALQGSIQTQRTKLPGEGEPLQEWRGTVSGCCRWCMTGCHYHQRSQLRATRHLFMSRVVERDKNEKTRSIFSSYTNNSMTHLFINTQTHRKWRNWVSSSVLPTTIFERPVRHGSVVQWRLSQAHSLHFWSFNVWRWLFVLVVERDLDPLLHKVLSAVQNMLTTKIIWF